MSMFFSFLIFLLSVGITDAAIVQVGPTRTYTTICAGIAASGGTISDTVEVDGADGSGNQIVYLNEDCAPTNKQYIYLKGVGSKLPKMSKTPGFTPGGGQHGYIRPSYFHGFFTIENFEGADARCAGDCQPIWFEQVYDSTVLKNVYFHDNDNCLLIGNEKNISSDTRVWDVDIQNSEFARCGRYGGGSQQHNVYIGEVHNLIFKYNFSHDSAEGQLLKARAHVSTIMYNNFIDSYSSGYSSGVGCSNFNIDLPSGGRAFVIGNLIRKNNCVDPPGGSGVNANIIRYCSEDEWPLGSGQYCNNFNIYKDLYVIGNTVINARADGSFIDVFNAPVTTQVIKNNIFAGPGSVLRFNQVAQANPANNSIYTTVAGANLVNATALDFRLGASSTAIDAAVAVGTLPPGGGADSMAADPTEQYVHPQNKRARTAVNGTLDNGALERTLSGTAYLGSAYAEAVGGIGQVTVFFGQAIPENNTVTAYEVYRNGVLATTAAASATSAVDSGGVGGTAYTYTVIAKGTPDSVVSNGVQAGSARACESTPGPEVGWHTICGTNFATTACTGTNCTFYWLSFAGSAFDPAVYNYVVWGGDPGQHNANEVYMFTESDLQWHRLNNSDTMSSGETSASDPNRPGARNPYQGLVFIPTTKELYSWAGYLLGNAKSTQTWKFAPALNTWSKATLPMTPSIPAGVSAWNSKAGVVNVLIDGSIYTYDTVTGNYARVKNGGAGDYKTSLVYDPTHDRLYNLGGGALIWFDPANSYTTHGIDTLTCGAIKNTIYSAVDWDATQEKIVYWDKSRTVITLDPATDTCTSQTVVGEPVLTNVPANPLHYSVAKKGFWLARNNADMAFLRVQAAPTGAEGNFVGGTNLGGGKR